MNQPISPSRRSVLRASAWSVPAIAVASAAPAFAASSCVDVDYAFSWSGAGWNYTPSSIWSPNGAGSGIDTATPNTGALPPGQVVDPLTLTVSNAFAGRMTGTEAGDGARNMRLSPFNVGALGHPGLTLLQRVNNNNSLGNSSAARRQHHQTMTFTFSRPVSNLSFTVTDIDQSNGQYHDRVEVAPAPAQTSQPSTVLGQGTTANPWRASANGNHDASTSPAGNAQVVRLSNAALSTFTITFWSDQSGTLTSQGIQGIFVSDLTFTASSCA